MVGPLIFRCGTALIFLNIYFLIFVFLVVRFSLRCDLKYIFSVFP